MYAYRVSPLFLAMALLPSLGRAQQAPPNVSTAIQAVEDEWARAYNRQDAAILERILSPDYYIYGTLSGDTTTKAGMIANVKDLRQKVAAGKVTLSVKNIVRSVRVYGDVAIALGEVISSGSEDGKAFTEHDVWQTVFTRRGGAWVAVASLQAPAPAQKKK